MTIRMLLWPWWARLLILAGLCASALTLAAAVGLVGRSGWPQTAAVIAAVSAVVGTAGALRGQRVHRAYTAAVDGLSAADRSAAITAISLGPLPHAPAVRAAMTRVGRIYLDSLGRSWSLVVVTAPILIVMFGAVAIAEFRAGEPAAAAPFGALVLLMVLGTAWCWYMPRRVRRRLGLLL